LEKKKLRRFAGNEEKASQKKISPQNEPQHNSLENNESLSKILLLLSFSSGGC
tara:strand:+ start:284 stop:442 length:159 start_codon:yes stop_codon:yes gene_type:complete